jgi:hypothetical protein
MSLVRPEGHLQCRGSAKYGHCHKASLDVNRTALFWVVTQRSNTQWRVLTYFVAEA